MRQGRFPWLWYHLLFAVVVPVAVCASEPSGAASGSSEGVGDDNRPSSIAHAGWFPKTTCEGDHCTIAMTVGTIDERHSALCLATGETATAPLPSFADGDMLAVRFVIADDLEGHQYAFRLAIDGKTIHRRSGGTRGFGRRTMFVPLYPEKDPMSSPAATHTLAVDNLAAEPLYLEGIELVRGFEAWASRPFPEDDFTLSLLVGENNAPDRLARVAQLIDAPTVRKAISSEIYYMCRTDEQVARTAKATAEVCEKFGLSFLPATCSWWAGTPSVVRERLDFQQVCWSATDTYDETEPLRKLLGDNWDLRYGLTVPNKWSNTPWQTMNSAELNTMRHGRMTKAVDILEKEMPGHIIGYVSENEPAYWAFEESDEKYPVRRHPLWADFNPSTVEDAIHDGVTLDPSDGLDLVERVWLHYNVAHYNEANIAAIREGEPSGRVYSHALLDYTHFPLFGTGHARPYAEAARVSNARLGVEMIWGTDMDALWRVREWGSWACVNREECDGFDIRYHIATLRACYMLGADLLNSYNWNGMGREGDPIEYFNTFLREVTEGKPVVVAERSGGEEWTVLTKWNGALEKNAAFPWCDGIEFDVRSGSTTGTLLVWLTNGEEEDGGIVAWREMNAREFPAKGPARIEFGDLAWVRQDDVLRLHLRGEGGWSIRGSQAGPDYRLLCDLGKERRRSQWVIGASKGSRSTELVLTRSAGSEK